MIVIRTRSCAKQLRFRECCKNLARQQLFAQSGVETFNDSVLPRHAWLDVQPVGPPLPATTPRQLLSTSLRSFGKRRRHIIARFIRNSSGADEFRLFFQKRLSIIGISYQ